MSDTGKRKLLLLAAAIVLGGAALLNAYDVRPTDAAGGGDRPRSEPSAAKPEAEAQAEAPLEPALPDVRNESLLFRSNGYTMPESEPQKPVPAAPLRPNYEKIGENGSMALYLNRQTFAIQLQDSASGYVWSSEPSESDLQAEQLNEDWKNAMQSPFLLDYYTGDGQRASSNYKSLQGKAAAVTSIDNGVEIAFELPAIEMSLNIRVALEEDGVVFKLLNDSLVEKGPDKLASVQLYPFLGAVRGASVPGYMLLPDGSGALIRFTSSHTSFDEPYTGQIYYNDLGIGGFEGAMNKVGVPVFGIVHGVKQNALLGIVEDGKMNAEIVAYPSGVNTSFYWISPRFIIRSGYYQPTSKAMGGINMYTKTKTEGDKQVRYRLLSGEQSDYVGMARSYRSYMKERGMLPAPRASKPDSKGIPLRIDMLGAEMTSGLLKRGVVKMTSFSEAQSILQDLQQSGISNIRAGLQGWGKGGESGSHPAAPKFEPALGGSKGLRSLAAYAKQQDIELYLNTDYSYMQDKSPRVEPRTDSVRMITNRLLEFDAFSRYNRERFGDLKSYLIRPEKALSLAKEDFQAFREAGIQNVAINGTGFLLYSDFNKKQAIRRSEAAELYGKLGDEAAGQSIGLSWLEPNDYMWKHAAAYFNMPLSSSQFVYSTDTVPFLPMALHGSLDYFADHGNNNPDPELDLLRMIEYGAYPSFLVTKEPTRKLLNTPSNDLYTTEYSDWAPQIKKQYAKANEALKQVMDAEMTDREVIEEGIVKVSYGNGVAIWINYTSRDYASGAVSVPARDMAVTGGGQG
ncbi:DUF5696 domain-containing protein [Paenibacillus sp. B01]|uniref:DUF5696 domain-containing protein n=1 Tax=Paenibacillus sp. B01 TaxID=2660554 RepID=UPI00129A8E60|nr:DUF5696 domain-containing protein [Paenibacillus sp. B01]QGG57045.1 hypothetical protein GE073_16610 [Paenibacillus sp. B01]